MAGRAFVLLLAALLALPAAAEPAGPPWKIGVLWDTKVAPPRLVRLADWLLEDLKAQGFAERELQLLVRRVDDPGAFREAARDFVQQRVHVIWSGTPSPALAAKAETRDIPIVFGLATDPVALGLVESIARPGGNVTGTMTQPDLLAPKRLELLREIVPRLRRVLVPVDLAYPLTRPVLEALRPAARTLGVTLVEAPVTSRADVERLPETLRRERVDGIVHIINPAVNEHWEAALKAIDEARVPDVAYYTPGVEAGWAVAAYGPNYREIWRTSARQLGKILRGTKPADLPVEANDIIELHVNVRVAKARGIRIPQTILLRAHKVFQ